MTSTDVHGRGIAMLSPLRTAGHGIVQSPRLRRASLRATVARQRAARAPQPARRAQRER
jgi:hypothetical protein